MVAKKPKGVLYLTADSSTGSKYYNLSENDIKKVIDKTLEFFE